MHTLDEHSGNPDDGVFFGFKHHFVDLLAFSVMISLIISLFPKTLALILPNCAMWWRNTTNIPFFLSIFPEHSRTHVYLFAPVERLISQALAAVKTETYTLKTDNPSLDTTKTLLKFNYLYIYLKLSLIVVDIGYGLFHRMKAWLNSMVLCLIDID